MLTLLEPPGAKRSQDQANRSAQHLLNLAPDEDDFYDVDYYPHTEVHSPSTGITGFLDKYLVWKSSSDEYNDKWKREFCTRPSWCDADLCLQQIKLGRAKGNKWALYSRSFIQKLLFGLGNFVHARSYYVIMTVLLLFSVCCLGLQKVHIETDIVKLWVAQGGRLDGELNFLKNAKNMSFAGSNSSNTAEIVRENGLDGGFQVVIQTPEYTGENILTLKGLLKHVDIMTEIAKLEVEVGGSNWTLNDICFKPAAPIGENAMAKSFENIIERIIPCIWITPIDCFWEGGKALGPHPAVTHSDMGGFGRFLKSLPNSDIKWTNFDPMGVIDEIHHSFGLGSHYTFFDRSGVGHGYLDRPCINPLDPECPKESPSYYDICPYVERFLEFCDKNNVFVEYPAVKKSDDNGFLDLFGGLFDRKKRSADNSTVDIKELCSEKRVGMMNWMFNNTERWHEFLTPSEFPKFPDYGDVMSNGCPGFAKDVLHWPVDMIIGGAKRNDSASHLISADALQSVFLVSSPHDVYLRFKDRINMTDEDKKKFKSARDMDVWDGTVAETVIQTWQRLFTNTIYGHAANKDADGNERRTIHPLASTSIADMLAEFCDFNYKIIFVGYGLMLAYAMFTQMKRERCLPSSQSCMGLALAGVLTVTFASVSGLGLATAFGIEFNAATTQIVPFLTLGIGVDNMFMLLHNYHDVLLLTGRHEMGILMRETGMSILCTSINNILSFLAGTLLPIPALRSFCAQSSILLTFNFIAILTVYPALISIDLRRRKAGRRDILCCLYGDTREENYSMITKPHVQQKRTVGDTSCRDISMVYKEVDDDQEVSRYTLHGLIRYYYIPLLNKKWFKIFVGLGSCALILLAFAGVQRATIGLELSDILPEHTAPAKFLQARDKYFSFYPMFAVIKGNEVDYATQQHQIDNYRKAIAASRFVIKSASGEPSEKYWLQMMRDWLIHIQKEYEGALAKGLIDINTGELKGNLSEDAVIGHRLVCSHGDSFECQGRVGKVQLVDPSGTIKIDGFQNYLTAWFNQENMMYYVSQASFYPTPPVWSIKEPGVVPAAEKLVYSQIPFYLTGLTDTPVIVDMIKEIREVCDDFAANGLHNFPQGIAFTFWEQYLHLTGNLMQAICIIALAVFVVISVLLFNPWAALVILVILMTMSIELTGFLGWAGIKMNPVSAVTLITAVGIGVEFTAHVVLAFLTSLGTREERTSAAVDRVFVPVIHGALSTLLGILMLGFSEFEFVFKYFFVVMSALIVIGVINGLILLPVLLSLAGPRTEVSPVDAPSGRRNRLSLPPPLRRPRRDIETDDEDEAPGLVMRRH